MRDAPKRETAVLNNVAIELELDRDGNQGECIGEPVANLQVRIVRGEAFLRQFDCGDDLASVEVGVTLRRIAGQPVELRERDHAVAKRATDMNLRVQQRQRHAYVGRVRRDAGVAGAEDGVHAILAVDGGAAAARLALIAGRRCIVEVAAARALQEVAARRRHIAQLLRSAGHDRAGENRIALLHLGVIGEIGVAYERSDTEAAAQRVFNLLQR